MESKNDLASQRMGTDAPSKLIVLFAFPSIFTMIVSSMYNVVDKMFIGHGVGYLGLAATTASTSIVMLMTACFSLVGTGASIHVAMALGEEDRKKASRIIGSAYLMECVLGVLMAVIGVLLLDPICRLTGADVEAFPLVKTYLGVLFVGAIGSCVGTGLIPVIRSVGKPKTALIFAVCGSLANCIMDPIFIFGFRMGIFGAALSTILAELLTGVLVTVFLLRGKTDLSLSVQDFVPDGKLMGQTLQLGFPGFLMTAIMSIMVVVFTNTLRYYGNQIGIGGDTALSALGLSTSIGDLINMISIGMQQGVAPLVAFNYAAKKYDRVKKIFQLSLVSLLIVLVVFWGVLETFPQVLIALFGETSNQAFAVFTVRVYNLALPFMAFQMLGGMYLQSIGAVRQATIIALTRNVFFGIPLLLILPIFFSVYGAMAMGPIADIGGAIVASIFTFRSLRRLGCPLREVSQDAINQR